MKRKYLARCWLCGSTDLEPDDRGMICRKCGASFNIIPKPGSNPVTMSIDHVLSSQSTENVKSSSPSGTLIRKAAKARLNTTPTSE